jgi:hypothetical protein
VRRLAYLLLLLVASGCPSAPADPVATSTPTPVAGASAAATATAAPVATEAGLSKEAALAQVMATVETGGCESAAQCRVLPAGAKACGGPSRFIVYCSTTTNEDLLKRGIDAFTSAELAWNVATGAMSDCAMLNPPAVALANGACEAH